MRSTDETGLERALLSVASWSTTRPRTAVSLVAALTFPALVGLSKLELKVDGRTLLARGAIERLHDQNLRTGHLVTDAILVAVEGGAPHVALETSFLMRLEHLTASLKVLPGVRDVFGITGLRDVRWRSGRLVRERFFDPERGDAASDRAARLDFLAFFDDLLVTRDRASACLFVELNEHADRGSTYSAVNKAAIASGLPTWVAGAPVAEAMMGRFVLQDLAKLIPAVVTAIAALLWFAFRSLTMTVITIAPAALATVWTFGLKGWLAAPVTVVSVVLPVILLTMGVADEIHLLYRYQDERAQAAGREPRTAVLLAMIALARPLTFTSLTTAVGFLAFAASPLTALSAFGAASAFGVLAALILSFAFVPPLIVLMSPCPGEPQRGAANTTRAWTDRRVSWVLGVTTFFTLLVPLGWSQLTVQDNWIDNFDPDSEIRLADAELNRRFLSTHVLWVQVQAAESLAHPSSLHSVRTLQDSLEAMEEVAGTRAITDMVGMVYRTRHRKAVDRGIMPETLAETRQCLFELGAALTPSRLKNFIADDRRHGLVHVFLHDTDYRRTRAVMESVERWQVSHPELKIRFGGDAYLSQALVRSIVDGQVYSLILALGGVLALCCLLFRSFSQGLLHLVPVAFGVMAVFGTMGLAGLSLGVATSLFAALSVGVGVDYATHWLARYREARDAGLAVHDAASFAGSTAGRSIALSTIVMVAGFALLLLSPLPPNQRLGGLFALSMLLCWVAAMTVLPALVIRSRVA